MLGLAIHTTSPQLGLMIQSVDGIATEGSQMQRQHQVWDLGRAVSSQFHVKLMEFIAPYSWQDVSFVAVAKGPGGFTGTRIGVVAARTLAQQLDIPLFGVSSLAAIAAQTLESESVISKRNTSKRNASNHRASEYSEYIVVTMPAKRNAVYGAIFRADAQGSLESVQEEAVVPREDWSAKIAQWQSEGKVMREIRPTAGAGTAESVTSVMALALAQWKLGKRPQWTSVVPFYGQHPVRC